MKCRELFDSALHLLSSVTDLEATEDYRRRLPFFLGAFVREHYDMDASWRARIAATGGTPPPEDIDRCDFGEGDDFPMSPRFLPAAAYYLASLCVMRENTDFADALLDRYRDVLAHIRAGIPAKLTSITPIYRI